jgi:hypothetical protein
MQDQTRVSTADARGVMFAMAAVAGLVAVLLGVQFLFRLLWQGQMPYGTASYVLFRLVFHPEPGPQQPALLNRFIDLLSLFAFVYAAQALVRRQRAAWYLVLGGCVFAVLWEVRQLAWMWGIYVLREVPAWCSAPFVPEFPLSDVPVHLLPLLSKAFLYGGIAAFIYERGQALGVRSQAHQAGVARCLELRCFACASALAGVQVLYCALQARMRYGAVRSLPALNIDLPAPFGALFQLGAIVALAYLTYGLRDGTLIR